MNELEITKLELKAMRIKNTALENELRVLKRYRLLVDRVTEVAKNLSQIAHPQL